MSSARRTFVWMGAFSVVTLLLGALRELVIARDLQASGAADLFFRGLIIVGVARAFGLALLRARWIPLGSGPTVMALVRQEARACALVLVASLVGLVVFLTAAEWRQPTAWVFVVAVVLAVAGSIVRALAERAGLELRGYVLEWSLPIGTIAGAVLLGHGALGPTIGMTTGLLVGLVVLVPALFGDRSRRTATHGGVQPVPGATRWLLLDTLAYVNLGLLDGALSRHVFAEGGFALLQYGYLFINASLAVPSAAATILALRIAGAGRDAAHDKLRVWALVAGLAVAACVLVVWAALAFAPFAAIVDRGAGWGLSAAIRPIVLCAVPFAALRLANTVGRQVLVAHDPRRLLPYDAAGLVGRAIVLVLGTAAWGVLSSPIGLAVAELVQVAAWIRSPRQGKASA